MGKVIVLGAKGRFGRAAATAFEEAGWTVTRAGRGLAGPGRVDVDATDPVLLSQACRGMDVIVNAVNPPYPEWGQTVPKLTEAVIAAARTSGATVMIPGNVYNYGQGLPPVLREDTPWIANTRKGAIRIRMERAYKESGVRTIVLRGGDFLATEVTDNWFEGQIAPKAHLGRLTYPGPLDQAHAWAFLPDMARAMVGLAQQRDAFAPFEEFGFDGFALTGAELVAHIEAIVGRSMRVSSLPWFAVRLMGLWSPLMREVVEMRYLWQRPHQLDGAKLRRALPDFRPTPVREAIAACLPHHPKAYGKSAKLA